MILSYECKVVKISNHKLLTDYKVVKFRFDNGCYAWDAFPLAECPKIGDRFKIEFIYDQSTTSNDTGEGR